MPAGLIHPQLPPRPEPLTKYDVRFQTNPLMAAFISLVGAALFGYALSFVVYDRMSVPQFLVTAALAMAFYHLVVALHFHALTATFRTTFMDWLPKPDSPGLANHPGRYRSDKVARDLQNKAINLRALRFPLVEDLLDKHGRPENLDQLNDLLATAARDDSVLEHCIRIDDHNRAFANWRERNPDY